MRRVLLSLFLGAVSLSAGCASGSANTKPAETQSTQNDDATQRQHAAEAQRELSKETKEDAQRAQP